MSRYEHPTFDVQPNSGPKLEIVVRSPRTTPPWTANVLLAAQALGLMATDTDTVVVTTNPKHLERFVRALRWRDL
jgi:hypothetical protein